MRCQRARACLPERKVTIWLGQAGRSDSTKKSARSKRKRAQVDEKRGRQGKTALGFYLKSIQLGQETLGPGAQCAGRFGNDFLDQRTGAFRVANGVEFLRQ